MDDDELAAEVAGDDRPLPDPMDSPDWSLVEALAWIMTREPEFLRSVVRDHSRSLISLDAWTADRMLRGLDGLSREEAVQLLWKELRAGTMSGTAVDDHSRRELRPLDWQDWRHGNRGGRPGADAALVHHAGPRELSDPSFRRDDVLRLWPAHTGDAPLPPVQDQSELPKSPAARRIAARKWYREVRVPTWTGSPRGPKATDDFAELKRLFGIGRRDAQTIRNEEAPKRWQQSGPKAVED